MTAPREITVEQGDALYDALGSLMATLRRELGERRASGGVTDAQDAAADREYRRWDDLRDALADVGCDVPSKGWKGKRPATVELYEDDAWLATTALRALGGSAHVLQLTVEKKLRLPSPLSQVKDQLAVLRGLETLLDSLGWPLAIPAPDPDYPWPSLTS